MSNYKQKPEKVNKSMTELSYSRSLRKSLRGEVKENDDDDNGHRKYRLREKPAKKNVQTLMTNLEPVKKVLKKKIKRNNDIKPQPKTKLVKKKKSEVYGCENCQTNYTTKLGLLNHMGRSHPILKFTCSGCSSVFDSNTLLIEHKSVHKDEDFLCTKCEETFIDHSEFLLHQLEYQNGSLYKCPECGKMFINKQKTALHIQSHFGSSAKCEKSLQSCPADLMEKHLNTHSKIKTCVECGKTFSTQTKLDYHMVSHTGLKTYQCYYCGKGFALAAHRDNHLRTHTKKRNIIHCVICDLWFKNKQALKQHSTKKCHLRKVTEARIKK